MLIRILGEVEVAVGEDRWRRVGPAKQSAVLAVLAMSPNTSVKRDALIHRVWGSAAPRSARSSLYALVAQLRQLLAPLDDVDLSRGGKDGYRLVIDPGNVDVFAMRRTVDRARGLAEAGHGRQAAEAFDLARDLWRGEPLAGVEGAWADRMRQGLFRERLGLWESRFENELGLGTRDGLADEIVAALEEYPRSETLAAQAMTALHRLGRSSESLEVYRRIDRRLRAEAGTEPGARLRETQRRVLRQEPDPESFPVPAPSTAVPRELPAAHAGFAGRAGLTDRLSSVLPGRADAMSCLVLSGMAGVGKTALALRWAHQVAEWFPDGQLFVDLRGFDATRPPLDVSEALAQLLRPLGITGKELPSGRDELEGTYRSLTAGRRLLVVLDNAAGAEQVRPLLPTGTRSLAVVTGRGKLSGLVAVNGARRFDLGMLPLGESRQLLEQLLGSEPIRAEDEAVRRLWDRCAGLPLAMRIAAANLLDSDTTIANYVDRMADARRLDELSLDGDPSTAVRAAFAMSYHDLSESQRYVFQLLSLLPGSHHTDAAVGAAGGLDAGTAARALRALSAAHLVMPEGSGRYALHDLLRLYSHERATAELTEADREEVRRRYCGWAALTARAAARIINSDAVMLPPPTADEVSPRDFDSDAAARAWLAAEHSNLVEAVADAASSQNPGLACRLADALRWHFVRRMEMTQWGAVAEHGLDAARRVGDQSELAAMYHMYGQFAAYDVAYDTALACYRRGLEAARLAGDGDREATLLYLLSNTSVRAGRFDESIEYGRAAVAKATALDSPSLATALSVLGAVCCMRGRLHESVSYFARAARLPGSHLPATKSNLSVAYMRLGRWEESESCAREALELTRDNPAGVVSVLSNLAENLAARGDATQARRLGHEALELSQTLDSEAVRADALIGLAHAEREPDPGKAVELASEAVRLSPSEKAPHPHGEAMYALVEALLALGDLVSAGERADSLKAHAARMGYRALEGRAVTLLAEIAWAMGDTAAAREHAAGALKFHVETGNRPSGERVARVLAAIDAGLAPCFRRAGRGRWRGPR